MSRIKEMSGINNIPCDIDTYRFRDRISKIVIRNGGGVMEKEEEKTIKERFKEEMGKHIMEEMEYESRLGVVGDALLLAYIGLCERK